MRALAESLKVYVERHFRSAFTRDPSGPVRPVLVGPPDEALREMFAILTGAGHDEWRLSLGNAVHEVVVLLVGDKVPPSGSGLSRGCHWDYAVTIRNSRPRVLILASRASWDTRPESLANTTERLGDFGVVSRGAEDPLQAHLIRAVSAHLGLDEKQARELLRLVRLESIRLEPTSRDAMSWEVVDNLLTTSPGSSPVDAACRAAGLPIIGTSNRSFRDAYETLRNLGEFVGSTGLHDAVDQMKGTNAAQVHGSAASLDALEQYLAATLLSPTAFATAPTRYFRHAAPVPAWHDALRADVLSDILSELNQSQPQDRLTIVCSNALADARLPRDSTFVVPSAPVLRASSRSSPQPAAVTFSRKVDRLAAVQLPATPANNLECLDASAPRHRKPIKYKAEAPAYRSGTVDVLVLDRFECGGIAVVRDAERNGVPVYAARAGTWTQELTLLRGGTTELLVFHAGHAGRISLARAGEAATVQATRSGSFFVSFSQDVEDNDTFEVRVDDVSGAAIGSWVLQVAIRDIADVAASRLEALVRQHQTGRKSIPHAPDTPLHRLELGSYLQSPDSWMPVLGCWASRVSSRLSVDWNGDRTVGDVRPQIDPRPSLNPPAQLIAAREAVRNLLQSEQRCISEIEIDNATLAPLVEEYIRQYVDWIQREPQAACWIDTFIVHAAEWNAQAGQHVASDEPVVLLLSPLHPLRLAWQAVAQKQLSDSLNEPCPAAGLLTPSQCPDAGILYLGDGQTQKPRAFFSLPCEHPHWAVLLNTTFLDKPVPRLTAMQQLSELGLTVQSITGGFTSQQTQDSLHEVNRLLPARSTLRVGIVGDAESSSECGDGVFRWSERQHSLDSVSPTGCLQVEVYDTRGAADPSPEQLADLSETTAERVRWFKLRPDSNLPRLDLIIIDQLGARSPDSAGGSTRSAISQGGLFRVRIREDFQNARAIVESRVASTRLGGIQLPLLLTKAIEEYEKLSASDASHTHFRFTPNQDAVGSRLQNAIFLSVTSSQVDPACVVRGAVAQGGYLWDYELPGVVSGGESSLGYYLVARPTSAMTDAVGRAASLIANPPPNIPGLLEEVSRHGIPILKRLAGGGSQSRGELGLLLATRLLQDAFRPGATTTRLPVWSDSCIHLVLPVDPYQELFDRLRRASPAVSPSFQRPDLIVVAIRLQDASGPVSIKLTPLEVKFRAAGMAPTDMRTALSQAEALGKLLEAVWVQSPRTDLWKTCGSALLAQFLDFGFRIYAANWLHGHQHEEWARVHQQIMQDVLECTASITVNTAGRLVVFDGSGATQVADLDGDGRQDTAIVSLIDSRALLSDTSTVSTTADSAVRQLDFSFPSCSGQVVSAPPQPDAIAPEQSGTAPVSSSTSTPPSSMDGQTSGTGTTPIGSEEAATPPPEDDVAVPQRQQGSRVPPEIRRRVREAFEGFVGNEAAVARLSNDLLRALIEQPPHLAKNYLFTGLPSTGKTELARRMAQALRLPFVKLDGRSVASRDKLFELVNGELRSNDIAVSQVGQQVGLPILDYPPLIIFIDEVHLVPRALQEALLTMLEAADRTVVLSNHVAHMHRATFLFATTRISDVDAAFASRCDEIQLREYSEAEVARILRWKVPNDSWSDSVYQALARLGRCVPRVGIQLAEALETAVLVSEEEKSVSDHLDDVRRAREIDEQGLTLMDFQYLAILERAGGPVGEQNLLNLMRTVDKDRILNEIEPFLVRAGFIQHGPRGRELTTQGRDYLLAHRLRTGSRA